MKIKPLTQNQSGLSAKDWSLLKKLDTPAKIQDFLGRLEFNLEEKGETYQSVKRTLTSRRAHCFEGALIAAAALWIHGERPLLLDLVTIEEDDDHVVTLYKKNGLWGAISKTNHAVLRFREPVYRNVRELVASYFHEYFLPDGTKTLRAYSKPFDLTRHVKTWLTGDEELYDLVETLHRSPHEIFVTNSQVKQFRQADKLERAVFDNQEYKPKKRSGQSRN
jgi:hypothetical protein